MMPMDLLYIEDDQADADFAETALREVGCDRFKLTVIQDGETAANSLGIQDESSLRQTSLPDMILLDLNIPRIHGRELLRRIKQSKNLMTVPVVILSTSNHQGDIDEAYRLGASGFFTKPASYEKYKGIFRAICDYWGKNAALPSTPTHS